jgi:hypothetical protein
VLTNVCVGDCVQKLFKYNTHKELTNTIISKHTIWTPKIKAESLYADTY